MTYKKLSLILLVAVLATTTFSLSHDNWECTHGHEKHPDPEPIDVEEDYNPNGNDHSGRTLASYSNLRTYGYYGALNTKDAFQSYVAKQLIPPILDYFSAALKVKYPVSGTIKVTSATICGITTPAVMSTGVTADYIYVIGVNNATNYIASSSTCASASGSKRPTIGRTTISSYYMTATTDPVIHERNMICIMHELIHTIGFSSSLYGNWLYSNGTQMKGHIQYQMYFGVNTTVIVAEPLTTKLRSYFGCSTLKGAIMENTGGSGTASVHFERSQFTFDIMTSGLINEMKVSQLTLSLLETTGWYVPDYTYADPFFFGQGAGCKYTSGTCTNTTSSHWCSTTARSCTVPGRSGGGCVADGRSDACTFVHPTTNYDCENTAAAGYARLPALQTFGRNTNSKCFTGTLTSAKTAGSQTTFCFTFNCTGSGSSTKLNLNVGGTNIQCTAAGAKTVTGYQGAINCPDPKTFCSTVGQKLCPRNCMGRGTCVNGLCVCNSGFKGEDCALNA